MSRGPRFSVTSSAKSGARNRGFDDAVAGRPKHPPATMDADTKAAYLQGYRRGAERREQDSGGDAA